MKSALGVLLGIATSAGALPSTLMQRDEQTCSALNPELKTSCPASLPSNFCCLANYKCLALAGSTTAMCCPTASKNNCAVVMPISCDVSLQDVSKNIGSPVKTTALDVSLQTCGENSCCPFGYSCGADGTDPVCNLDKDQSVKPGADKKSPSSSSPSSSITGSSSTPTASPIPATSTPSSPPATEGSNSKTTYIIIGAVGGSVLALVGALIMFCYCRRRKINKSHPPPRRPGRQIGYPEMPKSPPTPSDHYEKPVPINTHYYTPEVPEVSSSIRNMTSPRSQSSISHQPININYASPRPAELEDWPRTNFPDTDDNDNGPFSNRYAVGHDGLGDGLGDGVKVGDGKVKAAKITPIRQMKASSIISKKAVPSVIHREPSSETIEIGISSANLTPPRKPSDQSMYLSRQRDSRDTIALLGGKDGAGKAKP